MLLPPPRVRLVWGTVPGDDTRHLWTFLGGRGRAFCGAHGYQPIQAVTEGGLGAMCSACSDAFRVNEEAVAGIM